MTVAELIEALRKFPADHKAVVDAACDYEDYDEVRGLTPGCYYGSFCGGSFNRDGVRNSVLIR